MTDISFRLMTWMMALEDVFKSPALFLKKAPLREGMTVVDTPAAPGATPYPPPKW
jgi:hypothetical protein